MPLKQIPNVVDVVLDLANKWKPEEFLMCMQEVGVLRAMLRMLRGELGGGEESTHILRESM
jgi:hypothetical protein